MRDTINCGSASRGISPVLKKNQEEKSIKDLSGLGEELKKNEVEFALPEWKSRPGLRMAVVKDLNGNKE